MYVDEFLIQRKEARENENFKLSDMIREYLDDLNVYVFDTKDNDGKPFQEVWYLPESYFKNMKKIEKIIKKEFKNKREFVEYRIKQDIIAEKRLDAWLYTIGEMSKK